MENIYWIGPRLSDILGVEHIFKGAIVFFGTNINTQIEIYSLEENENIRINHNDFANNQLINKFLTKTLIEILSKDDDAYFMFYCDIYLDIEKHIEKRILCNNKILLSLLSDKFKMRNIFYPNIKSLNSKIEFSKELSFKYLKDKYASSSFIVQLLKGSGGNSRYFINSNEDDYLLEQIEDYECLVSKYIENAIPINVNIFITQYFLHQSK